MQMKQPLRLIDSPPTTRQQDALAEIAREHREWSPQGWVDS